MQFTVKRIVFCHGRMTTVCRKVPGVCPSGGGDRRVG